MDYGISSQHLVAFGLNAGLEQSQPLFCEALKNGITCRDKSLH